MIKFLLLFILSFNAFAAEVCNQQPLPSNIQMLAHTAATVGESTCHKKAEIDVLDVAVGCLSGGGKAVVGMVKGFIEILRLLVVEAPSYLWKEGREKISKLLNGDMNPAEMAATIANINMGSQSQLWDTAKEYWKAFKSFAADLKNQLMTKMKAFPCLPLKKQSEIVCRGVSEVFLLVVGPGKFIQGAKWGISTAQALNKFVNETKAVSDLSNLSLAKRLDLATKSLKGPAGGEEILKLRNARLVEVELPNGEKILQYHQKIKGKDGKMHDITREVPLDAKTQSIDANSAIGKEIMAETVKAQGGKGSLVFIDVNHLGKVNYFKGGTQSGDQYLTSAAESIRKTLRPGDMVFKNGGDELVVVLSTNNAKAVKDVSQRMMNEVNKNPQIRQIFKQEVVTITKKYKEVYKAKSINDLNPQTVQALSAEEKKLATSNFKAFQKEKTSELKEALQDQASYRGSISVGASMVKHNETVQHVLTRAEHQAAIVKTQYKAKFGHDVSKYHIEVNPLDIMPRNAPPQALDPI